MSDETITTTTSDETPWYKKSALWAAIVGLGAVLAGAFGFDVSSTDQQSLAQGLTVIGAAVSTVIAIWKSK